MLWRSVYNATAGRRYFRTVRVIGQRSKCNDVTDHFLFSFTGVRPFFTPGRIFEIAIPVGTVLCLIGEISAGVTREVMGEPGNIASASETTKFF